MPEPAILDTTILELEIERRLRYCVSLEMALRAEQGAIETLRYWLKDLAKS